MRVTINLARHSGARELVEVLHAVEATRPGRSSLHPLTLLEAAVRKIVHFALTRLELAIRHRVCGYVTCERRDKLNRRRKQLQQKLLAWLRIPSGRVAVKA